MIGVFGEVRRISEVARHSEPRRWREAPTGSQGSPAPPRGEQIWRGGWVIGVFGGGVTTEVCGEPHCGARRRFLRASIEVGSVPLSGAGRRCLPAGRGENLGERFEWWVGLGGGCAVGSWGAALPVN